MRLMRRATNHAAPAARVVATGSEASNAAVRVLWCPASKSARSTAAIGPIPIIPMTCIMRATCPW